MAWTTFTLTVTTPLFNGDDTTALRVSSLRGAMRYWFRALAGTRAGSDITTLAELEQKVFGDTKHASPVRLRITSNNTASKSMASPNKPNSSIDPWVGYLLGQGHYAFQKGIVRPFMKPGPSPVITLKVRFSADTAVNSLILASLWLVCAYGGVGARTRRGFGGLRITGVTGALPEPWTAESVLTPGLDHYEARTHLAPTGALAGSAEFLDSLLSGRPLPVNDTPDQRPSYPVLSAHHTYARLGAFTAPSWEELAVHTGEQFRRARATKGNSGSATNYTPKIKTPEHLTVVHGDSSEFPLGAFGLPVNYSGEDASVAPFAPDRTPLRRASPLWLRFVGGNGQWRLFSFAFHSQFLPGPDAPAIHLRKGGHLGRQLRTTDAHVKERTTAWIDRMAQEESPTWPLDGGQR